MAIKQPPPPPPPLGAGGGGEGVDVAPRPDGSIIILFSVPSLSPSPSPPGVASRKVSPTSTPSSEGKRELPGFEAASAIIGLLAIAYLVSKMKEAKK